MNQRAELIANMSEGDLHAMVCRIAGYSAPFTKSWDHIIALCTTRNFLKHPRYIARTQTGSWVVREHQSKAALSRNDSGPIALCQFVAIIAGDHQSEETT